MFDLIDKGLNKLGDLVGGLGDSIVGGFLSALDSFIGMVMYYITKALMYLVSVLQSLFNVFAGLTKVQNNGTKAYLINVFFNNTAINNIYWAMALLGMTFVIAFTIVAVIRKGFDLNDKRQNQSMGSILGSMFKSILIMLLLTGIMSAALSLSNEVIQRVSYIFDNADSFNQENEIRFTDEQYATMARIYKTIGNYSLNPSYTSRYNINSCYNELRPDLLYLQQQGVFDFVYVTEDPATGSTVDTWQSVLQELVYATDVNRELNINVYHEEVSGVLIRTMDTLRTNRSFFPLEQYGKSYTTTNSVGLDKIIFLSGTTSSAINQLYNINPHMTDGLRGAFYIGEKSIYSFSDVKGAFEVGLTGINYILIWVLAYFTLRNLLRCIFACISRIFNMVSLYLVAPLTLASMPLDEGEKFKQWTTTMIIQGLVIFGNIIPMRLIILFAPVILSPNLVLFESTSLNFIAKALLIVGGLEAVEGFSQIVTGILANSAGMAAVTAGNRMQMKADSYFGMGVSGAMTAGKTAARVGWGVTKTAAKGAAYAGGAAALGGLAAAGLAVGGVGAGLYHGGRAIGHGAGKLYDYLSDKFSHSGGGSGGAAPEMGPASNGFRMPTDVSGQTIEMQDLSTLNPSPAPTETQSPLTSGGQSNGMQDLSTLSSQKDMQKLGTAVQNIAEGKGSVSDAVTVAQNLPKMASVAKQAEKAGVNIPEAVEQMMGGKSASAPQSTKLNYSVPSSSSVPGSPSAPSSPPMPSSPSMPSSASMPGTPVKQGADPLSNPNWKPKANRVPPNRFKVKK